MRSHTNPLKNNFANRVVDAPEVAANYKIYEVFLDGSGIYYGEYSLSSSGQKSVSEILNKFPLRINKGKIICKVILSGFTLPDGRFIPLKL